MAPEIGLSAAASGRVIDLSQAQLFFNAECTVDCSMYPQLTAAWDAWMECGIAMATVATEELVMWDGKLQQRQLEEERCCDPMLSEASVNG